MTAYETAFLVAAGFWLLLGAGVPFFFFCRDLYRNRKEAQR